MQMLPSALANINLKMCVYIYIYIYKINYSCLAIFPVILLNIKDWTICIVEL